MAKQFWNRPQPSWVFLRLRLPREKETIGSGPDSEKRMTRRQSVNPTPVITLRPVCSEYEKTTHGVKVIGARPGTWIYVANVRPGTYLSHTKQSPRTVRRPYRAKFKVDFKPFSRYTLPGIVVSGKRIIVIRPRTSFGNDKKSDRFLKAGTKNYKNGNFDNKRIFLWTLELLQLTI